MCKVLSHNSQQGTLNFDVDPVFDSVFPSELTEVNSVFNSDSEILDIKGKRRWQIVHSSLCVMLLRILLVCFKLEKGSSWQEFILDDFRPFSLQLSDAVACLMQFFNLLRHICLAAVLCPRVNDC